MRLFAASYTAEWSLRTCGEPLGIRLLHAPVPPNPLALVSTQTSFKRGSPAAASSDNPANRMIRFDEGSYTERSEERRVGKEWRSLCDWSSDVCSSDLVRRVVHCRMVAAHLRRATRNQIAPRASAT